MVFRRPLDWNSVRVHERDSKSMELDQEGKEGTYEPSSPPTAALLGYCFVNEIYLCVITTYEFYDFSVGWQTIILFLFLGTAVLLHVTWVPFRRYSSSWSQVNEHPASTGEPSTNRRASSMSYMCQSFVIGLWFLWHMIHTDIGRVFPTRSLESRVLKLECEIWRTFLDMRWVK